jgi:hypothetical protein
VIEEVSQGSPEPPQEHVAERVCHDVPPPLQAGRRPLIGAGRRRVRGGAQSLAGVWPSLADHALLLILLRDSSPDPPRAKA